jgi:hypothetical protein
MGYSVLLNRDVQSNQLNGTLTIPMNVGKNLRYVQLQNNQLTSINQPDPNAVLNAEIM